MVQLGRILFAVSLIAATLATPTKRTVAQVEADLTGISSDIGDLNTRVKGFPASGLTGALVRRFYAFELVLAQTSSVGINWAYGNCRTTALVPH